MAGKTLYPSTKTCHHFSINDEYDHDNDGDGDDDDGDDDDNDDDDDGDDDDDDDGIITERKTHCMEIMHATITEKYSIRNLLQTCASGKKRKTYRRVSISTFKYGLGPHLWDMPKTRAS
jgi:deferrochelatase/peroxidase EfeB